MTTDGIGKVKKFIQSYYEHTPIGMAFKIGKMIFDSDSVKKQAEGAVKLIIAGKCNDVYEMDIIVDNRKGLNLDVPNDIKISTTLGSNEKMRIHVKYK